MDDQGNISFLKLARKFFRSDLWNEPREYSRAEAWLDMIATATFAPETRLVEGRCLSLHRGELPASLRYLACRWSWSKSRVERFLDSLADAKRVNYRDANGTGMRVVVLCNYDFYNTARDELGTATRTRAGQSRDKVKELKNERSKERLNDANRELSPSRKAVSVNRSSLNRSIERDLMGRLREALGKDEMARAGGHWRQDWVRPHPILVTSALDEMNCMLKEGREIGNRGAWLEDVLKRWKETKW